MLNIPTLVLATLPLLAGPGIVHALETARPPAAQTSAPNFEERTAPPAFEAPAVQTAAILSASRWHSASFATLASDPLHFHFKDFAPSVQPLSLVPEEGVWNEIDPPWAPGATNEAAAGAPTVSPRAIPEPNIYMLMLAGLAAGAWASRRRRR